MHGVGSVNRVQLTYFKPMFHFYTPLKISENLWFADVFRGYRNGTMVCNGLINGLCMTFSK